MFIDKKLLLHNRDEKIRFELNLNNEEIEASFKKEKFQKMSASPYAFYRGSNHLYWEDFYNDWRISFFGGTSSTLTWINGDAHIYNYGAYTNLNGDAVFCMDDFDDSVVADYQFDLWRMAISIVLDCRDNNVFDLSTIKEALQVFSKAYMHEMIMHNDADPENEVHLTKSTSKGLLNKFLEKVEKKKSRIKMLDKWTAFEGDQRKFNFENKKLEQLTEVEYKKIEEILKPYSEMLNEKFNDKEASFQLKDIAKRINAGTGSLGSSRYYILLEGLTLSPDDDLILDMKEQGRPPVYRHMSKEEKVEYAKAYPNEGERHAHAFEALAEHVDKYLGALNVDGISFSIKERSPMKSDFPSEKLKKPSELYFMADVWGEILASRHKRASYVLNDNAYEMPNAINDMLANKKEEFQDLVSSIALQYADRVKLDYACFLKMGSE
jgi:uncharacterized protein (DUF2252 family)